MQSQSNECFLQVIVAQLANQKRGRGIVAVIDHVFQKFAVGVYRSQGRNFKIPDPPFLSPNAEA